MRLIVVAWFALASTAMAATPVWLEDLYAVERAHHGKGAVGDELPAHVLTVPGGSGILRPHLIHIAASFKTRAEFVKVLAVVPRARRATVERLLADFFPWSLAPRNDPEHDIGAADQPLN